MFIGIDLDNTIINYEDAFLEGSKHLQLDLPENITTKTGIRNFLRKLNNGELLWQKLQGLVYGKLLYKSGKIYSGVYRFLWRSHFLGNKIKIVSHKTEFGHFDEDKISLREEALKFIQKSLNFKYTLIEEIVFKDTLEEKLEEIKKSSFPLFIDDLPEIISKISSIIPKSYLFSEEKAESSLESKNWAQIDFEVNGDWKDNEIIQLAQQFIENKPKIIEQIKSGGNSGVYKLEFENSPTLLLKIYSQENNQIRLQTEFNFLTLFKSFGISNIPKPILKDDNLGIAFYEWIEGVKVYEYSEKDIFACIKFIENINQFKTQINFHNHFIPNASAACFSLLDIENQIEKRFSDFNIPMKMNTQLNSYLKNEFYPLWKQIANYVQTNWTESLKLDENIPQSERILSPSDYGFHNALKSKNDEIYFLDFEYFGWDDPVKLASDFCIHPGMNLNKNLTEYWIKNFFELIGQNHLKRFHHIKFLYWMVWPLITLNDFRDEVWLRRNLSLNSQVNREEILKLQLNKSRDLLNKITLIFNEEVKYATT